MTCHACSPGNDQDRSEGAPEAADRRRTIGERVVRLVTEVRRDETPTAVLMTLHGFLLLMAYSCIKPVREALILALPGGAEYKVYMAGATAAVLLVAVPVYSRFGSALPRNRLVVGVTTFFASHLVAFYAIGMTIGPSLPLALGFYLWIAVFNMMIVAQFWAFATDLYTEEAGTRLFPLIGLGASVGAVTGATAAKLLIGTVGPMGMMPLAAAILVVAAGIAQWVHVREVRRATSTNARDIATRAVGGTARDAFRAVLGERYLLLIAVFSLVFTMAKTNGDYVLARIVQDAAHHAVTSGVLPADRVQDYIGSFFANFSFRVDVLSLLIQAIVVSRLIRYVGPGASMYVLPVIALADAAVMAAWPALRAVSTGKTAESATDYSLNNTVRNMLWLPASRSAKYLAKQATDTFFVRMGDVSSAALVFVSVQELGLSLKTFAVFNVALVFAWLLLARAIVLERSRLERGELDEIQSPMLAWARQILRLGSRTQRMNPGARAGAPTQTLHRGPAEGRPPGLVKVN